MTESEAQTRWCPFAASRVLNYKMDGRDVSITTIRPGEDFPSTQCLGSGCMAWRRTNRSALPGTEHLSEGRCGLAGP